MAKKESKVKPKKTLRSKKDSNKSKKPVKNVKKSGKKSKKAPKTTPKPKNNVEKLTFFAQIKQTNQSNNALTLDNNYYLKLATHDSKIMDLGKLPPLTLVKVTVAAVVEGGKIKTEDDKVYQ